MTEDRRDMLKVLLCLAWLVAFPIFVSVLLQGCAAALQLTGEETDGCADVATFYAPGREPERLCPNGGAPIVVDDAERGAVVLCRCVRK